MKTFTRAEVATHADDDSLLVAINGEVFDVTKFANLHPGGREILKKHAGKDATEEFGVYHNVKVLDKFRDRLKVGELDSFKPLKTNFVDPRPYAEPPSYQKRLKSPYLNESHFKWRDYVRKFVNENVLNDDSWWNDSAPPRALMEKMGSAGLRASMLPPPYPADCVDPNTPRPEGEYDVFHAFIVFDEISRCGNSSVVAALTNGPAIAVPGLVHSGFDKRVVKEILMGRQLIALGVSEPNAGSDVRSILTSVSDSPDQRDLIVNGSKKWITNGYWADRVTLLCADGGGHTLLSVAVDDDLEGFSRKKVAFRNPNVAGTSYLYFQNVKVGRSAVVGARGDAWAIQMKSFGFERLYLAVVCLRLSRIVLAECLLYASKRKTFGKLLHQHQHVRMLTAEMMVEIEACQQLVDALAYQYQVSSYDETSKIGDLFGLAKAQASKVYSLCASHAEHIFGGNAQMANGPGFLVELASVQAKGYVAPGGANSVMHDAAARSAFRKMAALLKTSKL